MAGLLHGWLFYFWNLAVTLCLLPTLLLASPLLDVAIAIVDVNIVRNHSACHDKSGRKDSIIQLNVTLSIESLEDCIKAATSHSPSCYSACWSKDTQQCHCHSAPTWMPLPDEKVDSAILYQPCTSPKDCSHNGVCPLSKTAKDCQCNEGWGGVRCGELQLAPVDKQQLGFREVNSSCGQNISTWGAPILWDDASKLWHGWASELVNGCGINAWNSNSQIVHITSRTPYGPYTRHQVFALPFAHEPSAKRSKAQNGGDWIMLYSAYNSVTRQVSASRKGYDTQSNSTYWSNHIVCTNCSQGACLSPAGSKGCPLQRGNPRELDHSYIQMMATAKSPYGPWKHSEIPAMTSAWDHNTDMVVLDDVLGHAVALIRGGMPWYATDYREPTTWHPMNGGLGPHHPSPQWSISVEDPYMWKDPNTGVLHALAHCFTPFTGVHAFVDPSDMPQKFSTDLMNWTVSGVAYGDTVQFTDGTSFTFGRRERPHLVWSADNKRPVALSNGVAYGKNWKGEGQDMTFTLVQPIVDSPAADLATTATRN